MCKNVGESPIAAGKGTRFRSGRELAGRNVHVDLLRKLAKQTGILGDIYAEAQSRFNNPVNLKKLINLIDEIEWTSLGVDVKAAAYEGLLEQAANEGKKGAGNTSLRECSFNPSSA